MRRSNSSWPRFRGYHIGVTLCAGLTGTVFLINLTLTIWALKTSGLNQDFGIIQRGNCHHTRKLNLWLHLVINVLSTSLLSASNYCMQCLSSPTRQDIDKAHAQNKWLDIGVPSVRNLRGITWKRIILWCLLAVTSLPLHLMYNSAVFHTLSTYRYDAYVVSKDFLSGVPYNASLGLHDLWWSYYDTNKPLVEYVELTLDSLRDLSSNNKLQKKDRKNCILTYGNGLNSMYGNVLMISTTSNATNSYLVSFLSIGPSPTKTRSSTPDWFHDNRTVEDAANNARDWKVYEYPIDYCLSQELDEKCMLQFSLPIMLTVIICNLIKTICMILVLLLMKGSQPLVIVGDAIASFLNEPDFTTKNICLADKYFFRKKDWQTKTMTWRLERLCWFRAASLTRWLVCNVL